MTTSSKFTRLSFGFGIMLSSFVSFGQAPNPEKSPQETTPSASLAMNISHTCTLGSATRVVALKTENSSQNVPCFVYYKKEDGSEVQLWRAQFHANYCVEKLQSFLEQLRSQGWTCQ